MKQDKSQLKRQLLDAEESRRDHIQSILQQQGPLREGSLVTLQRKCGKANCHCATEKGHTTSYLSTKVNGKTRMIYVPAERLAAVQQEAERYRGIRKHRAAVVKLSQRSLQLIDQLQIALLAAEPISPVDQKPNVQNSASTRRKC